MSALFLIPARGGSKGIPDKNIRLLNGKPLIHYSIQLARKLAPDSHICVSTDSPRIAACVRETGLDVPFMRPAEYAGDSAGMHEVIKHAISHYEGKMKFDKVVLLQPTSPLRLRSHVEDCLRRYDENCDMAVSVKKAKGNIYQLLYTENKNGCLDKLIYASAYFGSRQEAPVVFQLNGAVYVYNVTAVTGKHPREFSRIRYSEMPEMNSVDIDEPLDWSWAEFLLEKKLVTLDYE